MSDFSFENQEKKQRASFSDSINFMIVLCFGIAFVVIYLSSVFTLLFQSEVDASFYTRIVFMFVIYLLIYTILSLLITLRIRKMFYPLDKLARGLLTEEIRIYGDTDDIANFAQSLRKDMKQLASVKEELNDAKRNLDDMQSRSDKVQTDMTLKLQEAYRLCVGLEQGVEHLRSYFRKEQLSLEELPNYYGQIKSGREKLQTLEEFLPGLLKEEKQNWSACQEEMQQAAEAFSLLVQLLQNNNSMLEELYSEITHIQQMAGHLKLSSATLSIEIARAGARNPQISNALAEVEKDAEMINEKTDAIALLLIQSKNAIQLSREQGEFCRDTMQAGDTYFAGGLSYNEKTATYFSNIVQDFEGLTASLEKMSANLKQLQTLQVYKKKELTRLEEDQVHLHKLLKV